MPHGTDPRGRRCRVLWWLVLTIVPIGTPSLAAQDLPFAQELSLKREYPGAGPFVCPDVTVPPQPLASERQEAIRLVSSADQALIQGDIGRAATLLERASEFDPSSSDVAYRLGRVLEDLGDRAGAIDAYCRVVAIGSVDETAPDAEARIRVLAEARWANISDDAAEAFELGLAAADDERFADAASYFGAAVSEAPDWADAVFNRALMLDRVGRGQEALVDLRRYLELRPDAVDAVAVSARIGQLEGASATVPSPGTALGLGLLVPGAGQFYSGRDVGGLAVLSLAGGAIAAGFLIEEVEVECLASVGSGEACPSGQVFRENVDRPYLAAGLGVAAGVAVIGAIEAFVKARRRSAAASSLLPASGTAAAQAATRPAPERPAPGELRWAWPSVSQRGVRVDVNVLRLTF